MSLILDTLGGHAVKEMGRTWPSIFAFNLLNTFTIRSRPCAMPCASWHHGGVCLVVTPAVRHLHDFPADYWRLMPDLYFKCVFVWLDQDNPVVRGMARAADPNRRGSLPISRHSLPMSEIRLPTFSNCRSVLGMSRRSPITRQRVCPYGGWIGCV